MEEKQKRKKQTGEMRSSLRQREQVKLFEPFSSGVINIIVVLLSFCYRTLGYHVDGGVYLLFLAVFFFSLRFTFACV